MLSTHRHTHTHVYYKTVNGGEKSLEKLGALSALKSWVFTGSPCKVKKQRRRYTRILHLNADFLRGIQSVNEKKI